MHGVTVPVLFPAPRSRAIWSLTLVSLLPSLREVRLLAVESTECDEATDAVDDTGRFLILSGDG